ncbi:MAG TPA: DUF1634 domain-containing protein [Peptococcaceae bacterium]|nr:MAG: hypothetical protein XD51_1307 [Moorella sp. 60_41]HBT48210.1 DUF1634 domain-containing protein [Peptococcaceae bacterium]
MAARSPQGSPEGLPPSTVEGIISRSLRWGVIISAGFIVLGLAWILITGSTGYPPGYYPTALSQVLRGALEGKPLAVVDVGLLILIATPVFRVAASLVAFLVAGDLPYVLISAYVLAMLLLSLLLGRAV